MNIAPLILAASVLCCLPLGASAQWEWLDQNNKKVFSDQAPPIDVPEKNILRRPGSTARLRFEESPAQPEAAPTPNDAAAAAPAAPRPSGVDKELEEKARQAEEAEKAKQAAEARKVAETQAANCARARENKATLDSGIRIARVNTQGEREILDDPARAAEQRRLQSVIDADCK